MKVDVDTGRNDLTHSTSIDTVEIAIAYCNADMSWMFQDILRQIPNTITKIKITVLSKCGNEKDVPRFQDVDDRVSKTDVNVISLANVGGCDYAYAHFLNRYIDRNISKNGTKTKNAVDSSVILFIKDTPRNRSNLHMPHHERYRSVNEMIQIASTSRGFSCGAKTSCEVSPFHDTATLYNFTKANYVRNAEIQKGASRDVVQPEFNTANYTNLRDFHMRALDWTFPNVDGVTESCYGGTFTASASKVMELSTDPKVRRAMTSLEDNLQRNTTTTIEEHFAERTWAGLLANPLSDGETHTVQGIGKKMVKDKGQIFGALKADKYATCSGVQLYKKYCRKRWCSLWSRF